VARHQQGVWPARGQALAKQHGGREQRRRGVKPLPHFGIGANPVRSGGDDFDPGAEAEQPEESRAFIPAEAEGPHISHAETGHDLAQHGRIRRGKVSFEHGLLRPINQRSLRDPPLEVGVQLPRGGLSGDFHGWNLRLPVASVHRVFFMNLHEPAVIIPDFLPETHGVFVGVHFLEVAGRPPRPSANIRRVKPSASRQILPVSEATFVLCARAQVLTANGGNVRRRSCRGELWRDKWPEETLGAGAGAAPVSSGGVKSNGMGRTPL
jgi:hypothetical protein